MSRNRRDLRRAAFLAWMIPLEQAESMRFWATRNLSSTSGSPASTAAMTVLIRVFISELMSLLAIRRRSFCRLRFFWDLMFAIRLYDFRGLVVFMERIPAARKNILGFICIPITIRPLGNGPSAPASAGLFSNQGPGGDQTTTSRMGRTARRDIRWLPITARHVKYCLVPAIFT